MLNWHDPTRGTESVALQVTVVMPTRNLEPDITTLPASSIHTMVVGSMTPSTVSLAEGDGDQVTLASVIPALTFTEGMLFGQ